MPTTSAPSSLKRYESVSGMSISKPWVSCLMTATR